MGLQHETECFCGDVYDKYGIDDEERCDRLCSGNGSQYCGGAFRNSVWFIFSSELVSNWKDFNFKLKVSDNYLYVKFAVFDLRHE